MNWFVHGVISAARATEFVNENREEGSCCEHVEADPSLATDWTEERDSFGGDGKCVMCKPCYEAVKEAEDNEEVTCCDCKQVMAKKDTSEYKWYDFHYPSGDEPLIICKKCVTEDRHLTRLNNDKDLADMDTLLNDQDFDDDYQSGPEDFED